MLQSRGINEDIRPDPSSRDCYIQNAVGKYFSTCVLNWFWSTLGWGDIFNQNLFCYA